MPSKSGRCILIVLGTSFPGNNAASARISALVTSFLGRGHFVRVATTILTKRSQNTNGAATKSVVLPVIVTSPFSRLVSNALSLLSSYLFSFALSLRRPDAVILSVPPHESAIGFHLGLELGQAISTHRSKLIYDYRDDILDDSRYEDLYRGMHDIRHMLLRVLLRVMTILIARSDAIVCTTQATKRIMIQRGFDAKKVYVIHNGADLELFKPATRTEKVGLRVKYGLPAQSFVLVAVSGARWLFYGLEPIIEALKMIKDHASVRATDSLFMIVGEKNRELQSYLRSTADLEPKIRLVDLGEIAHNEIPDVLRTGDVGIIPLADYEFLKHILPVKLFEYCACGLPVLATTPPNSLTECIIRKHSLGFAFHPKDVKGLADAIRRLWTDDGLRKKTSLQCRTVMEREFDRRALSSRYTSLVEELLDDAGAKRSST